MAPLPNESSLYDSAPTQDKLVSWKDDPSPAVFETSQIDTLASSSSTSMSTYQETTIAEPAKRCSCKRATSKVTELLKESWTNPRYFRWIMTIAVSVVFALVLGFFMSFGPLYMCLRRDLQSTAVETGWVASLGWSIGILSPFVNTLYQRFGPRKIAIAGILLCSVGLLSSSFVSSIWPLFVTFSLFFGLGVNCIITGSMSLVASHFDSNDCALPTTLPGVGGAVGMLIYCPVLELAYEHLGWRMTLRIVASIIFVVGLSCAIWQKRPASQKETTTTTVTTVEEGKALSTSSSIMSAASTSSAATSSNDAAASSAAASSASTALMKEAARRKSVQEKQVLMRNRRQKSKENYIRLLKDPVHWMFCVATMLSNVVMIFNVINLLE